MNSVLMRALLVYGIVIPLAVVVGWMLSSPLEMEALTVVGAVIFTLLLPILLAYHHTILVFSWQAMITVFFLPGAPYLWTVMVAINLAMALMYRILQRQPMFLSAPSITVTVSVLIGVILVTAQLRGGIGVRALGSGVYGAKTYFYLLAALLGYFALASRPIPTERVGKSVGYFYLSGLTAMIGNLLYPFQSLWFLYLIFPSGVALSQAYADYFGIAARLSGVAAACSYALYFLLVRWGIRGMLAFRHFWRIGVFAALLALALWGGYRSTLAFIFLLLVALYLLEGLLLTKWTPILVTVALIGYGVLIPVVTKLPVQAQRALSILPLDVDPGARADAQASWEWRVGMWRALLPELPNYVWLGKGYTLNPTEMYLAEESVRRGLAPQFANSLLYGDYHNGPLSVFIPLGLPGVIAFIAVLIAIARALFLNYRHGPEALRGINRFLFAFFLARFVFFVTIFGSFAGDMAVFCGLAGLSVSMNRGICRKAAKQLGPQPARPRPFGLSPQTT